MLGTVIFVIPSLDVGGMERVMSVIVNYFSKEKLAKEVHLIVLTKKEINFSIHKNVVIHEPDFNYINYSKLIYIVKTINFLRKKIKLIRPNIVLSFGDRYNSFVILSSLFLKTNVYVSNRMNPTLSNGIFIDIINKVFYRFATGIIAQTKLAKDIFLKRYNNKRVIVIPNPINRVKSSEKNIIREDIILNVGRFVDGKNQYLLIDYFKKINPFGWKLIFLGNGPNLESLKKYVRNEGMSNAIEFHGNIKNIESYYNKSKIFAFTSSTEGFPNVLGEAMSAKLASISFDCITGPSDLIDNNDNGFLIPVFNDELYIEKLKKLIKEESLRERLGEQAYHKIENFTVDKICRKYYDFFLDSHKK